MKSLGKVTEAPAWAQVALHLRTVPPTMQLEMSSAPLGGRYVLQHRLGSGGMGAVYLAHDTRLQRGVAVKVLSQTDNNEALFYFHREARALAQIQHASVVQVFDYSGPLENPPYLVMEHIDGDDLKALTQHRGLPPESVILAIIVAVADALDCVHSRGLLHRDIKPANIMIDQAGRTFLADFGVAKAFRDPARLGATMVDRVTKLYGTPQFVAPEQITDEESSPDSDVFSLGSVVYWLATGESPFAEEDQVHCLRRIAAAEYVPLAVRKPDFAAELGALVGGMLQRLPANRLRASEVRDRARAWLTEHGIDLPQKVIATYRSGNGLPLEPVDAASEQNDVPPQGANADTNVPPKGVPMVARRLAWMLGALGVAVAAWIGRGLIDARTPRPAEHDRPRPEPQPVQAPVVRQTIPAGPTTTSAPADEALPKEPQETPRTVTPPPRPAPRPNPPTPAPVRAAQGAATLRLFVRPWGEVHLDGELVGNTPMVTELTATRGPHTVRVTHPNRNEWSRVVHFGEEHELRVTLNPL